MRTLVGYSYAFSIKFSCLRPYLKRSHIGNNEFIKRKKKFTPTGHEEKRPKFWWKSNRLITTLNDITKVLTKTKFESGAWTGDYGLLTRLYVCFDTRARIWIHPQIKLRLSGTVLRGQWYRNISSLTYGLSSRWKRW